MQTLERIAGLYVSHPDLCQTSRKTTLLSKKIALAATWACEKFRDYMLVTKFILETDHRPLIPLLSSTKLSKLPARILCFRLKLMHYSTEVKCIQGVHQKTADALSRTPFWKPSKDDEILVQETEEFKDYCNPSFLSLIIGAKRSLMHRSMMLSVSKSGLASKRDGCQ